MKKFKLLFIVLGAVVIVAGAIVIFIVRTNHRNVQNQPQPIAQITASPILLPISSAEVSVTKDQIVAKYSEKKPQDWSENIAGSIHDFSPQGKQIALTFDACPRSVSDSYDKKLIDYLAENNIPATLFVSGNWALKNEDNLKSILTHDNFEIENHGVEHKPCSSNGQSAYGITGTKSVSEIFDEVQGNVDLLEKLTGRKIKYYRPATGFADDVCLNIVQDLGEKIVNWSLAGDGGVTYPKDKIVSLLSAVEPGQIVIIHMNHPGSPNSDAVAEAIPILQNKGFSFVKLEDVLN